MRPLRRHADADQLVRAALDETADRVLDRRIRVPHARGRDMSLTELRLERSGLRVRDAYQWRSTDERVAAAHLDDELVGGLAAAPHRGEVTRQISVVGRRAVGHEHDAGGQAATAAVCSRTYEESRARVSASVSGSTPCPRLKMWPARPPAR